MRTSGSPQKSADKPRSILPKDRRSSGVGLASDMLGELELEVGVVVQSGIVFLKELHALRRL